MARLNPVSVAVLAGLLVANWCQLVSATPALIMNQIYQLALEELDPIVNPNAQSSHMHSVFGGSAFGASYSYADAMAGSCTSTYITADKSNYWAPQLYWSPDPNAASPAFYPAQSLLRIYYFVGRQGTQPNSPFPEGLRMIVGSPNDREGNEYIQHSCATSGSDYASSDNFNMNLTCSLGVRTLIYFPPCWDGINLYKSDGSHMAYPVLGYRDGGCPWTHPVKVPAMFYELTWKLPPQASGLPVAGHLVWANGDTTGYGAHADFTNGWDTNVLATILNDTSCTGGSTSNVFDSCASAKPYVNSGAASSCKPDKGQLAEPYPAVPWSPVPVLPGCNAVWNAGVPKPTCNPKPAGLDVSRFTGTDGAYQVPASQQQALKWPTTPGWSSIACLASVTGVPIFTQSTSFISSSMTVEMCTDSCARNGFKYAALSAAPSMQCMCGAALTDNAPMTSSDQCATPCPGNANQMCGGSYNWALWYTANPSTALSSNSTDSSSLGCYSNPSPVATANGLVAASSYGFSSGSMTTATCKAGCLSFNYDWAATMNGGNCYCGTNAKFTLGTGSYVPQSMCNTPCLGNKTEMCGGYNNLDIFNLTTTLTPGSTSPATSVPTGKAAGWQSCRNDSPRGMTAAGATVTPMTPDYCKVSCAEIGYPLAGLSFGNRCYCGDTYAGGGVLPVAQCGTACTGNGNFTCGGSYTLDLYNSSLSSATFPDPVTQHSAGWQGCYANGKVSQDYTFVSQVMTPEVCMSGCAATDYKYAAIYGKYCYCGNTLSTGAKLMSLPNCNTQCAGKASQWCGGYNNQDVYSIASSAYGSGANSTNSTSTGTAPVCYGATSSGATALNGPTFTVSTMTNAVCATGCMELGYKLSGTRAGNTCVCGNAIDATASKQAPTLCNAACAGAASEFCGASSYMSISTASALGSAVSKDNGYQGCFAEGASAKALTGYSYTATTMTNSLCKAACAKAGFSLSGTENGNGCFCGNSFGGGAQTATARCNSPCAGNSTQSCGGGTGFLSLWNSTVTAVVTPVTNNSTSNTTTPATGSTGATGYLGCFTDTNTVATYFYSSGLMSNAICVQQCYAMGYAYSATGNGNSCRCGNTVAKALTQKANCNTACAGTSSDMCGGGTTAVSVYDVNVAERNLVASGQAQNQTFGAMGSMGCRYNGAKGALLAASSISTGTMTPTQCIQSCGQQGYALAGTVAGSYCWCDNNLQNSQGGGYPLPDSSCNKPCSGDASQMCGATAIINVYNVKASGVDTKTLSAPGYQGCFAAGTFISAAPYTENDGYMTTDTCRVSCNYKGYAYAGITGGRVCYCSATANMGNQLGDVSCSTKCVGDSTQFCGGSSSVLSVYSTKDAIIAKAGQPANYRGCFLNSGNPNVMPNWSLASGSMTPTLCQQNCKTLGYQFAGLEAGNICRCGTALPPTLYSDAACNSPCTGSSSTTCGGYHADAVYDVTASGTPVAAVAANSTTSSAKPASASVTASASSKPASVSGSSSSKPASVSATSSKPASVSVSASSSKPASVSASSSKPASVSASSSKPASASASSSKPASVSASSSKPASVSASSTPASAASSSKPATVSVSATSSKPASVSASSSKPASISSSAPATTASSTKLSSSFASSSSSRPVNSTSTVRTASSSLPSQALVVTSSTSAGCAAGSTQVVTKTVTVTAGAAGTPAKRSRGKAWAKRLYRESSESF